MEITQETLDQLYTHYDELDSLNEKSSDAIKAAQQNGGNRVVITRDNGAEQEVTEKMLWDEVWNLTADSEAGRFLRNRYPETFSASDAAKAKAAELREFTLTKLGIDAQQIKLSDIIKLTQAVVRHELQNHHGEGKADTTEDGGAKAKA